MSIPHPYPYPAIILGLAGQPKPTALCPRGKTAGTPLGAAYARSGAAGGPQVALLALFQCLWRCPAGLSDTPGSQPHLVLLTPYAQGQA